MRIPSGTSDQYIYFVAVDSTDYVTRETGLSSFTVYRSRNGAAAAAMSSPTVNEVDASNMPGVYELLLDEDMTIAAGNDTEEMVFHITKTGMAPVTRTIELYRPKITEGYTLGVNASGHVSRVVLNDTTTTNTDMRGTDSAGTAANLATVDTVVDAIKAVTDNLPNSGALSDLATAANLATVDTVVDGIQADLSNGTDGLGALKSLIDTVDTVVDAIKVVTDALPNSGALTDLATASALATVDTVVDGIQTDLSNGTDGLGALKALIDTVDTVADAVKAKTDQLVFTVANQVDANALTGGGGGGASAADVYTYFTDGTREDAFKADVTALATASALTTVDTVVDAIKASTDALTISAIADGVWDESRGTRSAGTFGYYLDQQVSLATGGGGVTYIVGHVPDRSGETDMTIYAGETVSPVITTRDASCTPVDLSSKTMKVVIQKSDGTDLQNIAAGAITVTSTSVSFQITTATTNSGEKSVDWSLRDAASDEVYLYGKFYIQTVAI